LFHRENMCSQFAAHTATRNKTQIKKANAIHLNLRPQASLPSLLPTGETQAPR
jgi:hypothetical protein